MAKNLIKKLLFLLIIITAFAGCGISNNYLIQSPTTPYITTSSDQKVISEYGEYAKPSEVAEYIHLYGKLPDNYITKEEAILLGWDSGEGNLWEVTDKKSIGGDRFDNREGKLPDKKGRIWYECDVNYYGGFRGSERLIYSNDLIVYYTADHYATFTKIY